MNVHFGIDCATYLDQGELTRVADTLKAPAFVGRYQPVYSVTDAEIAYLHSRGGALLCIDNEDQTGTSLGGSYQAGRDHGARGAGRWKAKGVPGNVAVFLDVEQSFYISPDYLAGWADGCAQIGLVGGVYLNSVAGNGHNGSYIAARHLTKQRIPIFASEPQPYSLANRVAEVWEPAAPDGYADAVVIWQYCINYGASDLDLCTDMGLAYMWGIAPPPPPAPKAWHVDPACDLKAAGPDGKPSHSSPTAIDEKRRPVHLERGADVIPQGTPIRTDDLWQRVSLPNSVVWGWVPAASVKEGI